MIHFTKYPQTVLYLSWFYATSFQNTVWFFAQTEVEIFKKPNNFLSFVGIFFCNHTRLLPIFQHTPENLCHKIFPYRHPVHHIFKLHTYGMLFSGATFFSTKRKSLTGLRCNFPICRFQLFLFAFFFTKSYLPSLQGALSESERTYQNFTKNSYFGTKNPAEDPPPGSCH